jgi:hypothetical protein
MAEIVTPEVAAQEVLSKPPATVPEEGMEILGPEPEYFETSQGRFLLGPMTMDQLAKFIPCMKKLAPILKEQIDKGELDFQTLAFADYPNFLRSVSIASGIPEAKLGGLFPDEMVNICTKVVVSNLDFFVRTLPKALGGAKMSIIHGLLRMVGAGPSNSSLPPATLSQPSGDTPSGSSPSSSLQ